MAEDFYEQPRDEVSQGDILELLPNIRLDHPLRMLQAQSDGSFICTGDAGANIASVPCRITRAMLLTHDCEIDKPIKTTWIINPIVPISEIPGKVHPDIRKNKLLHLVHLAAHRDILSESVIVLNHMTTLDHQVH